MKQMSSEPSRTAFPKLLARTLGFLILCALTLISFAPLCAGLLAGAIASAGGCRLDEGSVHPCVIAGHDVGDALYTGFVLTWLVLLTWPGMLLSGCVWAYVLIRRLLKAFRPGRSGERV